MSRTYKHVQTEDTERRLSGHRGAESRSYLAQAAAMRRRAAETAGAMRQRYIERGREFVSDAMTVRGANGNMMEWVEVRS